MYEGSPAGLALRWQLCCLFSFNPAPVERDGEDTELTALWYKLDKVLGRLRISVLRASSLAECSNDTSMCVCRNTGTHRAATG